MKCPNCGIVSGIWCNGKDMIIRCDMCREPLVNRNEKTKIPQTYAEEMESLSASNRKKPNK